MRSSLRSALAMRVALAMLVVLGAAGLAQGQVPDAPDTPNDVDAPDAPDDMAAPDAPAAPQAPASDSPAGDALADDALAEDALADEPSDPPSSVEPGSDPASDETRLPEAHRPTLGVTVQADDVRTGDLVRLVITAEVPEGDDVGVPEQQLGTFEIHDRRYRSEPVARGARRRFVFELDLLALAPGDQELPAISLRVVTADGLVGTVQTEARTVRIGSHIANEPDAQPRPPTAPRPVLEEDYTLLWVLGALLALLVTAVVSWLLARWWARRPSAPRAAPPPRPPWEVALEQLELVRREKTALLATEAQGELVDRVSDVLRQYLGQRYDFNGLESTTDEVVTRLSKVKLRGVALGDVTALLADSDLVKFAKAIPDEAQCDRMLEGAVRIVRATTPRPEATPSARPEVGAAPARVVTREGEVVLPITAHSIEEAERAIRAAVGSAFREVARDPSFEGTLRVLVGPALRPDANSTDALRRLHGRLSTELATMPLPSGRQARLVFEHVHSHRARPGEAERKVVRTLIDEAGVRVEERAADGAPAAEAPAEPAAEPVAPRNSPDLGTPEPPPRGDAAPERPRSVTPSSSDETVETPTRGTPASQRSAAPAQAPGETSAEWRSPPAVAPRERVRTGPVEWAPLAREAKRDALRADLAQAPQADPPERASADRPAEPVSAKPATPPPARSALGPKALDRVLPTFHVGADSPPAGALLRWVTGLERPVLYDTGEAEPLSAQALRALGVTRGGLHERALANLRRNIPPGFAPDEEAALLDDPSLSTILALPELVPVGHAWVAYPVRGEGLFVMREDATSTRGELLRLAHARTANPVFERPVRVSRRGFEPLEWPSVDRTTDPGFAAPDTRGTGGEP